MYGKEGVYGRVESRAGYHRVELGGEGSRQGRLEVAGVRGRGVYGG